VATSPSLTEEQRELIRVRLKGRIDRRGVLQLSENRERSQWKNREKALEKFREMLRNALKKEKMRVKTRATTSAREDRLQTKRLHSGKKTFRRKPQADQD
jgi:ribosome-associated protein